MKNKNVKKTSANIDIDFACELNAASVKFQTSEMIIFKDIVDITIHEFNSGRVIGILTEYQDHSPENWETLYYSLDAEQIERFSKARQKYKLSVSKIAFIGFLLFWKILLLKYIERLKMSNFKINFHSYDNFRLKLHNLVIYFHKRLNIILKE